MVGDWKRPAAVLLLVGLGLFTLDRTVAYAGPIYLTVPSPASGTVTLVTWTDLGTSRLVLSIDGRVVASCPNWWCSFSWDTRTVADGAHKVIATQYGPGPTGPVTGSATKSVTVTNQTTPQLPGYSATDDNVYQEPDLPRLPAAGQGFLDPIFGTTVIRVTDASTAPYGASVNSSAQESMFNADGTLFYLHHRSDQTYLYAVNRETRRSTRLGAMPTTGPPDNFRLEFDGAAWDPVNPRVLYAIVMSSQRRELWQLTFPLPAQRVMLHDFSREIPRGGYPYGRIQVSSDGRYFGVMASTSGGQDTYDYVVIWDRHTGQSRTLHTSSRIGRRMHSLVMDATGTYAIVQTADYAQSYIWHWPSDTLSVPLGIGSPYHFGGHKALGAGVVINPGGKAGLWVSRPLSRPDSMTPIIMYPRKEGKGNWYEDSHSSALLQNGSFFQSRYVTSFVWGSFVLHRASIYRMSGLKALSADFDDPEFVRYQGKPLRLVSGIPYAPNQWYYNAPADTLYVWLPDSSNPQSHRSQLSIFDWRPLMGEIIQVFWNGADWTLRRLAHHRMQYTGNWESSPRGNADRDGSSVLFQSNWGGSTRTDVFLLVVPPLTP